MCYCGNVICARSSRYVFRSIQRNSCMNYSSSEGALAQGFGQSCYQPLGYLSSSDISPARYGNSSSNCSPIEGLFDGAVLV